MEPKLPKVVQVCLIRELVVLKRSFGHYLPLSPARRLIGDLLYFAAKVPSVPVQRQMDLFELYQAREKVPDAWPGAPKPRWPALFLKAFAMTAREMPILRRAIIRWPRERVYEHPHSVVSVAVSKSSQDGKGDGEEEVLFGHIHHPETMAIGDIETKLRQFKELPAGEFGVMRRARRIAKLPRFLRRLLWWSALDWSGPMRANHMGTFGLSVYSGLGAESLHPLSPLTTCLTFGPVSATGQVTARIIYDHRAMDGSVIARALARMEEVMRQELAHELRGLVLESSSIYPRQSA